MVYGQYICNYIKKGAYYNNFVGLMIESNINEGKQSLPGENNVYNFNETEIKENLEYDVSITDCCVNLEETLGLKKNVRIAICNFKDIILFNPYNIVT